MDRYVEHTFGELRVRIDKWSCVGYGDCMSVAPEVFEFDERGLCSFRAAAADIERDRLLTACAVCPSEALAVFNTAQEQLIP